MPRELVHEHNEVFETTDAKGQGPSNVTMDALQNGHSDMSRRPGDFGDSLSYFGLSANVTDLVFAGSRVVCQRRDFAGFHQFGHQFLTCVVESEVVRAPRTICVGSICVELTTR